MAKKPARPTRSSKAQQARTKSHVSALFSKGTARGAGSSRACSGVCKHFCKGGGDAPPPCEAACKSLLKYDCTEACKSSCTTACQMEVKCGTCLTQCKGGCKGDCEMAAKGECAVQCKTVSKAPRPHARKKPLKK